MLRCTALTALNLHSQLNIHYQWPLPRDGNANEHILRLSFANPWG